LAFRKTHIFFSSGRLRTVVQLATSWQLPKIPYNKRREFQSIAFINNNLIPAAFLGGKFKILSRDSIALQDCECLVDNSFVESGSS
jgi:hypothetical protein